MCNNPEGRSSHLLRGGSLQSRMVRNSVNQETIMLCHFCRWYSNYTLSENSKPRFFNQFLHHAMLLTCLHSYTFFPAFASQNTQVKRIIHVEYFLISCRLSSEIFASNKTQRIIMKFTYRSTLMFVKQILFWFLCIQNNFYCIWSVN
jgi:hypothetical protein